MGFLVGGLVMTLSLISLYRTHSIFMLKLSIMLYNPVVHQDYIRHIQLILVLIIAHKDFMKTLAQRRVCTAIIHA
jgi:hypothetical protein